MTSTNILIFNVLEDLSISDNSKENVGETNKPTILVVVLVDDGDHFP